MKTIDLDRLAEVTGGVRDPGDGRGCTPNPFPLPRPPIVLPGSDGGELPRFPIGGGPSGAR